MLDGLVKQLLTCGTVKCLEFASVTQKYVRRQREGIDTIKYHT